MRSIAHHDHGQKPERMKFLRIMFGCPEGVRKWRILFFAKLLHSKKDGESRLFSYLSFSSVSVIGSAGSGIAGAVFGSLTASSVSASLTVSLT